MIDLKEWRSASSKTWLLHLVDNAIRYYASVAIKSKKKNNYRTVNQKDWIKIFGHYEKFSVDNGGEFRGFCENLNLKN